MTVDTLHLGTESLIGFYNIEQETECYLDEVILMQSTGLKDKNGKEIYEGDVLSSLGTELHECYYENELCSFMIRIINLKKEGMFGNKIYLNPDTVKYREVIGNIHENPELLK